MIEPIQCVENVLSPFLLFLPMTQRGDVMLIIHDNQSPLTTGVNSGAPEGLAVHTPHVLLLLLIVHEQTDFVFDKHDEYNCNYC
jgi:hypothetical protein